MKNLISINWSLAAYKSSEIVFDTVGAYSLP